MIDLTEHERDTLRVLGALLLLGLLAFVVGELIDLVGLNLGADATARPSFPRAP